MLTTHIKESGVPVYMLGDIAIPTNITSSAKGKSPFIGALLLPAMRARNMMQRQSPNTPKRNIFASCTAAGHSPKQDGRQKRGRTYAKRKKRTVNVAKREAMAWVRL